MSEVTTKELPDGWQLCKLGDVMRLKNGYAFKSKDYSESGTPLIRISDLKEGVVNLSKAAYIPDELVNEDFLVENGDLLIAMSGATTGKIGVYKGVNPALQNQRVGNFKIIDETVVDKRYRDYYVSSLRKDIEGAAYGGAQPNISSKGIEEFEFPLAPPEQQKRIVAKIEELFSHIDAGIEALKKAKQLLKQYRQSVLKAAVTGELTKEWREANKDKLEPASQLLKSILEERRQKWEVQQLEQFKAKGKIPKDDKWKAKYKEAIEFDSDAQIPEKWVGVTTDQVFYFVTSGSRGWAKYYSKEGPIFLRMGNLEHYDVRLDLEDIQRVRPPKGAEGSRTKVEPGDSLISITADVGMVGIVPDGFEEAYINQHVSLARPVIPGMGLYLAWLLSGDFAKEQFKALQRGATKVGLGLDDIRAIQFGLPSLEEQKEIVRLIEEKLSSVEHLDIELDQQAIKAEKSKHSVLASVFSGGLQ